VRVVIRIGGSVVASPLNASLIGSYVDLLKKLREEGHEVITVVGGGSLAREFIRVTGDQGLVEADRDWAAIHVSRLFARLFVLCLGEASCENVSFTLDDAVDCLKHGNVVVMGGLHPGMTTDAVAALIGEKVKANLLVKASNVEGIFTKDPKKFPDAKKLDEVGFEDLERLFDEDRHRAGIHQILDPEAVKILRRCRLRTVVVNGFNVKNVVAAIKGKQVGTIVE
jgi:uridylate kinase